MEITQENKDGVEIFYLEGSLALVGVKAAKEVIKPVVDDASITRILLNMKGVSMLDSSGIGFLVATFKATQKRKGKFALCNCNDVLMGIFKSTHLDNVLSIFPTEEEALTSL